MSEEKGKVLVVDDDITLRDMYAERLRAEGYKVEIAQDGEQGLARATEYKPDIILLDIMMPKINGFTVLDILKTTPELKDTPVILLTALIQEDNKVKGLKAGASEYIVKSETMPGEIIEKVSKLIKK